MSAAEKSEIDYVSGKTANICQIIDLMFPLTDTIFFMHHIKPFEFAFVNEMCLTHEPALPLNAVLVL